MGPLLAMLAAGCSMDPGAPLIPTPPRQATVLPSQVPPVRPDGYPNVLADPATVAGLPRTANEIAAAEAALDRERVASQAEARRLERGPSFAAELAAEGRTHVADRRRAIEAEARPQTDEPARLSSLPPLSAPEETPAAVPLASAPRARTIGAAPALMPASDLRPVAN